ncbi:reactive intermediate/imine deaminase [Pontibacter ummariensis]|uniref:Reactive intermediate/imine deaminase n=1 Tax=Pontibacter ummariensis TaxID=1610492 RepID=A0A239L6Z2_9BACT|nr:RidA family protein [Pontibacter ummariensis]PRY04286.1 reactive intermediate/imine deaminase [Pontibacter ummariensis]SNT25772.1 reactive intermediate/imine deaminase [Pontibacter ummariensis]
MKIITNEQLPAANGHYSTAIISNNLLFVSGQLPVSTDGTHHHDEPFERQFEVVFENILQILHASDTEKEKIVKVTAYISDVRLWPEFNKLYASFMGEHKPVRTVVPVPALHYGYQLEVELIAEIKE